MIILKSNYSPERAGEQQEEENGKMLDMLLYMAGLDHNNKLELYCEFSGYAAKAYTDALGEYNSNDKWKEAIEAAKPHREAAEQVLVDAGITVANKLCKPESIDNFHWIETTVYNGGDDLNIVAKIERAIIDIEAETYRDNHMGFVETMPA